MFEKLTPRERKLMIGVACLLPITLIFGAVMWYTSAKDANFEDFKSLTSQIEQEQERKIAARKAGIRREYFNGISLPPNVDDASNAYYIWLKQLLREAELEDKGVTPRDTSPLKQKRTVIGERKLFAVKTSGTLKQLTDFLGKFYSADLLHRINSIKVIPQNEVATNDKKIRTGKLSVDLQIEVLALNTAVDRSDFTENFNIAKIDAEKWQAAILKRDIFGPSNNSPIVKATTSTSYKSGSDIRIRLTGEDADEDDQLTFELVESAVEGVELDFKPGDRNAYLLVPGQKAGRYKHEVRILDNGFPPKTNVTEFTTTFKDPAPIAVKEEPKPEPPFIHATETRITGIVRERTGDWQVWILVATTGEKHKLSVGESFELDEKKWTVETIEPDLAVLRVDGKLLTFERSDRFNAPRSVETIAPAADSNGSAGA